MLLPVQKNARPCQRTSAPCYDTDTRGATSVSLAANKKPAGDGGLDWRASLTLCRYGLFRREGDTLGPDNGGVSGSDYWLTQLLLSWFCVRRAAPRPIHRLRWYRAST